VISLVWIAFSIAFSYYAANPATYNKTYGSLGAMMGVHDMDVAFRHGRSGRRQDRCSARTRRPRHREVVLSAKFEIGRMKGLLDTKRSADRRAR
jgi:hypothetical protein